MAKAKRADPEVAKALVESQFRDLTSVLNPGNMVAVANLCSARAYARMHGFRIRRVSEHYRFSRAFVIDKGDLGLPECWVAAGERGYRRIFHAFLRGYAQFPRGTLLPANVHVDHILARHICKAEAMVFGRVAIVSNKANLHHGPRERAYVENALAIMPKADIGDGNGFVTDSGDVGPQDRFRLEMRPLWGPQLVKLLPEFVAPATGKTSALDVLGILRAMRRQSFLPEGDLDLPFGLIVGGYRLYAPGIPHYDAQTRCHAYARDGNGGLLTPYHSLRQWLEATALTETDEEVAP